MPFRTFLLLLLAVHASAGVGNDCGRKVVFSARMLSTGTHTLALPFIRPESESPAALKDLLETLTHGRQFLSVDDGEAYEGLSPNCSLGECVVQYFPERGSLSLLLPVATKGDPAQTDCAHLDARVNQVAVAFLRAARKSAPKKRVMPRVRLVAPARLNISHIPANDEGVMLITEILAYQEKDPWREGNVWCECVSQPFDRISGPQLLERWFVGYFDQSEHAAQHVILFSTFLGRPRGQ